MNLGFISRYERFKVGEGAKARGFSQAHIQSCPALLQLLFLIGFF